MRLKQTLLLARTVGRFRLKDKKKKKVLFSFFEFFFKEYLTCVIKSGHVGGRLTAASARWLLFSVLVQGEYKNLLFRMNSD